MSFQETFLASLSVRPNLPDGMKPEQLLVNCYDTYTPNPDLIHLAAGGFIEYGAPFSYEIANLPCYLLLYTVSGSGIITTAQETISLSDNTLLFLDCRQAFKLNSMSHSWRFYIAFLTGNVLSTYYNYLKEASSSLYALTAASGIPSYIKHLTAYSDICTPADVLAVSKWLNDILTEACIASINQSDPDEHLPTYIVEMKHLLDYSYAKSYSLDQLEERFGINKYRLCRDFSHYYQTPPLQYLNARRIEVAKNLLLTTDMPIHEVGTSVGIENTNHFINLFKKNTGTTPFVFKQAAPATIRELHSPYRPDDLLQ
jgi:AraC-like DNA-binding protein